MGGINPSLIPISGQNFPTAGEQDGVSAKEERVGLS